MAATASPPVPPRLEPWPRTIPLIIRVGALIEAVIELLWVDVCAKMPFRVLYRMVAGTPVAASPASYDALTLVRVAARDACIFYCKPVRCLQGSAVVTRMLRRRGLAAQMLIGYQSIPVRWHAWVELDGVVVWDRISGIAHYREVDRL